MEKTITLKDLFRILKGRFYLVLLIPALAIAATAFWSYIMLVPIYATSAQILVNTEQGDAIRIDNQTIETDLKLINTYNDIVKSPVILDKVIELENLDMAADELTDKITVENNEESQVISITVVDESLETAVRIANTTAEVFQSEIPLLMDVNNVSILTPAVEKSGQQPIAPNTLLNIAIAAGVGLVLGIAAAILLNYLDNTLKNESDINEYLNIPVVGIVSPIARKEKAASAMTVALDREEV